jgi:hypothetical protein
MSMEKMKKIKEETMNAYEVLTDYACNPKRCIIARSVGEAAEILSQFEKKADILSIKLISNKVYAQAGFRVRPYIAEA